jgi:hypothetical protein
MRRGGHRISRYIIVGMPQNIRSKKNPNGKKDSRRYPTYKILYIKIRAGAFAHGAIFSLGITIRNRMRIMYWQEC